MPYHYLDEIATADIAFEAWGGTMEEMFVSSADALMNVMVEDLATVRAHNSLQLVLEHEKLDLLLFNFLQELVFYKDARRLLLRIHDIEISCNAGSFSLRATAMGEEVDPLRHQMNVDVKAVTLHMFNVELQDGIWRATAILDI